MSGTILLVEDDFALAMGTEYALQAEGYQIVHAGNIRSAKEALNTGEPDLILLDVMLPDGNGYELCREIRQVNPYIPIIFLTAVGEEVNIVQGLELGADDYVTKPYRVKELLSRIAANLRRAGLRKPGTENMVVPRAEEEYAFGTHIFYGKELRLLKEGQPVELTPNELRLLREFIRNEGIVLTRNQLLERIYDTGEAFVDDNTLSVYMKRLRDKLGADAEWIETVRGIGYRFRRKED